MEYQIQPSPILRSAKQTFGIGSVGTFTPALHFSTTDGDLSVTYLAQEGQYMKMGEMVMCAFYVLTNTFTYTTASGSLYLSGFPFDLHRFTVNGQITAGGLTFSGITKAGYTQFTPQMSEPNNCVFYASGSGVSNVTVTHLNVPSTSQVLLQGNIWYRTIDAT